MPNKLTPFLRRAKDAILGKTGPPVGTVKQEPNGNACGRLLLWAPKYNALTEITGTFLDDLPVPPGFQKHVLSGLSINRAAVAKSLAASRGIKRIKIFCGYGVADALLGPPQLPGEPHSAIYDGDMVDDTPGLLFAFCCDAALELGSGYYAEEGKAFIGYNGLLPLVVANDECIETWASIVRTVSKQIMRDGEISQRTETTMRNLYEYYSGFFSWRQGRANDMALLMTMYLQEHLELICRYP